MTVPFESVCAYTDPQTFEADIVRSTGTGADVDVVTEQTAMRSKASGDFHLFEPCCYLRPRVILLAELMAKIQTIDSALQRTCNVSYTGRPESRAQMNSIITAFGEHM
jgi:hypothetical protein